MSKAIDREIQKRDHRRDSATQQRREMERAQPAIDEQVKELLSWVNKQIVGIKRSSLVEASRGALNAFEQVKLKLLSSLLPVQPATSTPTDAITAAISSCRVSEDEATDNVELEAYNKAVDDCLSAVIDAIKSQDARSLEQMIPQLEVLRRPAAASTEAHEEELAREQIVQAITDIQEARLSHLHWAEHFEAHPEAEKQYESTGEWDNAKVHREWVEKYDNMLAILARFPFAYLKTATPRSPNRDYTKHPEVWLRERRQQ